VSRLLLVPTGLELGMLLGHDGAGPDGSWRGFSVACSGFGPVDAAWGAMAALAATPGCDLCLLCGLAGTYDALGLPVATVVEGSSFRLHGVGVGREPDLVSAGTLGASLELAGPHAVRDLEPATARLGLPGVRPVGMLTVCAASGDLAQAAARHRLFPDASIEEMEAWAVARAALQHGVPFTCLRAISNVAGDRDHDRWQTRPALAALRAVLESM